MTGAQFRTWRKRMKISITGAARLLGVSKATISRWDTIDELPAYVGLACAAISMGIPEVRG